MMDGLKDLDYIERLRRLHLTTIETRFSRADLIEIFKTFKGFYGVDPKAFFILSDLVYRGHDLKLYKNQTTLDIRKYSFSQRVVNEWNRLLSCVVDSNSVNNFKGGLNRYLKDIRRFI